MRYLFGFMCVLALGVVGCETTGTGGNGGTDCTGVEDFTECTLDGTDGRCIEEKCLPFDCSGFEDRTECLISNPLFPLPGLCLAGSCVPECNVLEEGSACRLFDETGVCIDDSCQPRCDNDADCTDYKDCTADTCLSNGLCESVAVQDGTLCAGGTCQTGECVLESTVLPCSEQGIRNAIAAGGDTPYTFDCAGATTVTTAAAILIDNDVILDGEGQLSVDGDGDGDGEHNVFLVTEGTTAELRGFTVTNAAQFGGAILNRGNLTVEDSTVSGNIGGGIRTEGAEGTLMLANSTVSENTGDGSGAIHNDFFATATVTNCTVSSNLGMGLYNDEATLSVSNTTVSGNTGGGLQNDRGTLTVANSLIDGDCGGTSAVTSVGYNIESPGDTCAFDPDGTDLVDVPDPMLGSLQENGGPTETHALLLGSPAINQIPALDCELTTDQRGQPRPETGGTMCDVGAFERQPDDQ